MHRVPVQVATNGEFVAVSYVDSRTVDVFALSGEGRSGSLSNLATLEMPGKASALAFLTQGPEAPALVILCDFSARLRAFSLSSGAPVLDDTLTASLNGQIAKLPGADQFRVLPPLLLTQYDLVDQEGQGGNDGAAATAAAAAADGADAPGRQTAELRKRKTDARIDVNDRKRVKELREKDAKGKGPKQ